MRQQIDPQREPFEASLTTFAAQTPRLVAFADWLHQMPAERAATGLNDCFAKADSEAARTRDFLDRQAMAGRDLCERGLNLMACGV